MFLLAVCRQNNYTTVIPLKNKTFDSLYEALTILIKNKHFAHITTILSDKVRNEAKIKRTKVNSTYNRL